MSITFIPPGPVASAYMADRSKISAIVGPYGSGKTYAAFMKLFLLALEQAPTDGVAESRFVVSRLTRPQLTSTTIKTFEKLFRPAEGFEPVESAALKTHWRFTPPGFKHIVDVDWQFLALETEQDEARILGLEATCIFVDEFRLIKPELIGKLVGRLRYPAVSKHRSLELVTNPWSISDPWHEMFVLNRAPGTAFFHQPGGLDKDPAGNLIGENLQNLNQSTESMLLPWNDPKRKELGAIYYEDQVRSSSAEVALLQVHSKFGVSRDGKPVYSDFSYSDHCVPLHYDRAMKLEFGHDFGLSSATVMYQQTLEGQLRVLAEFVTFDQGDIAHFEKLRAFVERTFPAYQLGRFTADPAGAQRGADGRTSSRSRAGTSPRPDPRTRTRRSEGSTPSTRNSGAPCADNRRSRSITSIARCSCKAAWTSTSIRRCAEPGTSTRKSRRRTSGRMSARRWPMPFWAPAAGASV